MGIQYADKEKQPGETIIYGMTFAPGKAIATVDTLTGSPTVTVARTSDSAIVTSAMLSGSATRSGDTISAKIIGGTDGENYKITFICSTTNGEVVEEDLVIRVREL